MSRRVRKAVGTQAYGRFKVVQRGRKCYGEPVTYLVVDSQGNIRGQYNDKRTAERDAHCLYNCGV